MCTVVHRRVCSVLVILLLSLCNSVSLFSVTYDCVTMDQVIGLLYFGL